jgi:hypothetical protein
MVNCQRCGAKASGYYGNMPLCLRHIGEVLDRLYRIVFRLASIH